jgi:hypothetical protein
MTDPTAKALLSDGVTIRRGAATARPVNVAMSLGIAGQNLEFGMMSGAKSWIGAPGTHSTQNRGARPTGRDRRR